MESKTLPTGSSKLDLLEPQSLLHVQLHVTPFKLPFYLHGRFAHLKD